MMKNNLFIWLILLFVLSACNPKQLQVAEVDEPTLTATVQITKTIRSTSTRTIIETSTVTKSKAATLPPPATISTTPTQPIGFDQARIFGTENRGSYFLVIFEIPSIDQVLGVSINGQDYDCKIPEDIQHELFCSGPKLRPNEYALVRFFQEEKPWITPLFEKEMYVAEPYKTPLPAGDPSTWCPQRGENITCETEHRVEDGEECWVSTCFDACGYYYSYHTCNYPPNNNFLTP